MKMIIVHLDPIWSILLTAHVRAVLIRMQFPASHENDSGSVIKSPLPTRFGTNLNNWTSINVFLKNNVWQSFDRVWIMKAVKSNKKNAIDSLEVNSLFSFTNMAESWCVKTALTCYFFCSDLEKQKIVQPNTRHQLCDCSHQVALLNDFFLEKMHMTKKETPATCTNKCVYFHGSVIFWTGNTTSSEPTCPLSLSLRCE
jgi:hypothetical protein